MSSSNSPKFKNGSAMNLQTLVTYDLNTLSEEEINVAIGVCILQQRTGNQNEKDGASGVINALFEIRRLAEQKRSNQIQASYLEAAKQTQSAADTQLTAANKINESIRYAAWAAALAAFISAIGTVLQLFKK